MASRPGIPKKYQVTGKIAMSCRPKKKRRDKKRICLMCDEEFCSVGGLRLCPDCQSAREVRSNLDRSHKFHGSPGDLADDE